MQGLQGLQVLGTSVPHPPRWSVVVVVVISHGSHVVIFLVDWVVRITLTRIRRKLIGACNPMLCPFSPLLACGLDSPPQAHDRTTIDLPQIQHDLAAAVLALRKPTVIFLLNGGAVSIDPEVAHTGPAPLAIIEAFYPGSGNFDIILGPTFFSQLRISPHSRRVMCPT